MSGSCGDSTFSVPVSETGHNIGDAMRSMGADEKCVSSFHNKYSSVTGSAGASIPFATVTASLNADSQSSGDSSSGCSDVMVQAMHQVQTSHNISCSIHDSNASNASSQAANAKITLKVDDSGTTALISNLLAQQKAFVTSNPAPNTLDLMMNYYGSQIKSLRASMPQLNITNSTLRASASSDMRVASSVGQQQVQDIAQHFKSTVAASAENELKKVAGYGAQSGRNVKQLVDQSMEDNKTTVTDAISKVCNKLSSKNASNGDITIVSNVSINIKDATLDADAVAMLQGRMITKSAQQLGQKFAQDLIQQATGTNSSKSKTKGIDALAKQLGENAANFTKASLKPLQSNMQMIMYVVIGVVALFVVGGIVLALVKSKKSDDE